MNWVILLWNASPMKAGTVTILFNDVSPDSANTVVLLEGIW